MKPIAMPLVLMLFASPAFAQQQDSLPPKPRSHAAPALTANYNAGYFAQELDDQAEGQVRRFEGSEANEAPLSQTELARQAAAPPARVTLPSVSEAIMREQSVKDDPRAPPNP